MVLVKNPHFYNAANVSIEQINYVMVTESSTAMAMYENGELDITGPPLEDMDRIRADPVLSKELVITAYPCTYYYGFNLEKPPVDNVLVRQALSYAIDRQKLVDTVTKGGQLPAWSFACPGIFGNVAENPDFPGITFDPDKAKDLLAQAGYAGGAGFPEMTLMHNTSEGHRKIAEFIQRGWKETLGIDVKLANQEWKVYLQTLKNVPETDPPHVWRLGWCADYPDQNNWVHEVFHPRVGANRPRWNADDPLAQQFMELTEAAGESDDPEERKKLYFDAEKILAVDNMTIIPIYYYTRVVMNKPYIERTYQLMGGPHYDKWKVKAH
jgi:oligopeptide transport system substrate-binding protein